MKLLPLLALLAACGPDPKLDDDDDGGGLDLGDDTAPPGDSDDPPDDTGSTRTAQGAT